MISARCILMWFRKSWTVSNAGGIVLRYGGLYTLVRGGANDWLSGKIQESPSAPNGLINFIHYDDAAEVVMSAFKEVSTF